MEAQITAGMKTPVLSSRPGPEGSAGDKGRKRESESLSRTQSTEREEQVSEMSLQKSKVREKLSHMPFLCLVTIIEKESVNFDFVTFIPCHCLATRGRQSGSCFDVGYDLTLEH